MSLAPVLAGGGVMRPYWQSPSGAVEVFHADTLQALAHLRRSGRKFKAIMMDPPYASGARTEAAKPASGAMLRGGRFADRPIECDQMTTTGFIWLIRETVLACRDMLEEGGALFSFIDWRQWPNLVGALESCNLRINKMVVWNKGSMGLGNGFRCQHELIAFASKGVPRVIAKDAADVLEVPDLLTAPREDPIHHPSPKPPELLARLLRVVTERGDDVLDPFMGGGATLEACEALGLRCVGIESIEEHCCTAVARLGAVTKERAAEPVGPLFGGA